MPLIEKKLRSAKPLCTFNLNGRKICMYFIGSEKRYIPSKEDADENGLVQLSFSQADPKLHFYVLENNRWSPYMKENAANEKVTFRFWPVLSAIVQVSEDAVYEELMHDFIIEKCNQTLADDFKGSSSITTYLSKILSNFVLDKTHRSAKFKKMYKDPKSVSLCEEESMDIEFPQSDEVDTTIYTPRKNHNGKSLLTASARESRDSRPTTTLFEVMEKLDRERLKLQQQDEDLYLVNLLKRFFDNKVPMSSPISMETIVAFLRQEVYPTRVNDEIRIDFNGKYYLPFIARYYKADVLDNQLGNAWTAIKWWDTVIATFRRLWRFIIKHSPGDGDYRDWFDENYLNYSGQHKPAHIIRHDEQLKEWSKYGLPFYKQVGNSVENAVDALLNSADALQSVNIEQKVRDFMLEKYNSLY